jgi:pimeloyl-ACP methyl ester carboxylesterase
MMPKRNHKVSRNIFLREVVKLNKKTMYAWIEYIQLIRKPELFLSKLDSLKKNILIISGDEDHCFIGGVKKLVNKKKSMELSIIEKCGHVCSIEKSKEFNSQVINYLNHPVAAAM